VSSEVKKAALAAPGTDRLIIKALTGALSELVIECKDDNGSPKAPSMRALRRAMASLPKGVAGSVHNG